MVLSAGVTRLTTRYPAWVVNEALLDLRMKSRHALVVEGNLAADEYVQDNTKTPYVYFRSRVRSGLEKLRGSKVQTATERLEVATGRVEVAQAKVNNLDISGLADQNILNLEIAVDNTVLVAVVEGTGDLSTKFSCLLLLQLAMRDDVVEHLAAIDKFEEHVPMIVCAHNIAETADVGVVE